MVFVPSTDKPPSTTDQLPFDDHHPVIGEDLTAGVLFGVLDPSRYDRGDTTPVDALFTDDALLAHYDRLAERTRDTFIGGSDVSVAVLSRTELTSWWHARGTDEVTERVIQAAGGDGAGNSVYPYTGDFLSILRAHVIRATLFDLISAGVDGDGAPSEETLRRGGDLLGRLGRLSGGYLQVVVGIGPQFTPALSDTVGAWLLPRRNGDVTVAAPALSDGAGLILFEHESERLLILGALGLGAFGSVTVLARSFGDRRGGVSVGPTVFGWTITEGLLTEMTESEAVLAQYSAGGGADDSTFFCTPSDLDL